MSRKSITLLKPTLSKNQNDLEFSIHTPPATLLPYLPNIFPDLPKDVEESLLLVPISQKPTISLASYGDEQQKEKDRLLESFLQFAKDLNAQLLNITGDSSSYWFEAVDPCTGQPYFSNAGSGIYAEADGYERLLGYRTENVGGCRVIVHPTWGMALYPATLFTTAKLQDLIIALADLTKVPGLKELTL